MQSWQQQNHRVAVCTMWSEAQNTVAAARSVHMRTAGRHCSAGVVLPAWSGHHLHEGGRESWPDICVSALTGQPRSTHQSRQLCCQAAFGRIIPAHRVLVKHPFNISFGATVNT